MCRKTMDMKPKYMKPDCLRRIVSPGSRVGWRLLGVSVEPRVDGALRSRSSVLRATIRKYIHQEKTRAQLAPKQLSKTTKDTEELWKSRSTCEETENTAALVAQRALPGAMAPENTTQYLMGVVYEDMGFTERAVSAQSNATDCGSEDSLDFQQRDFEEQFGALW